uniref:NADH-ubiquinone oxidoreductase chain 3 n=1 Tax=Eophreatoicus karrkkanj TaxID=496899 RepID=D3U708_9CRUS|nr:NADH dehydrogenase subunit 3 [Eophreatoicus sp. 14 FK-2009]ACN72766.1 NADH dehydrogenase subunit 3 [Eophreatoicus karrkkanj]
MYFLGLFMMLISIILLMLAISLGGKLDYDREKLSPFECGFDPLESARVPFSLRFYFIVVVFLIFDVEITLLLPIIISDLSVEFISWLWLNMGFIFVLLAGLYYEWGAGLLEWKI